MYALGKMIINWSESYKKSADLSICALQEVRRLNKGLATISSTVNDLTNKFEVHRSGNVRKRIHGVGIVIKVDLNIEVNEVIFVNSRIIVADVIIYGCSLKVISCYAPTEDDSKTSKDSFYNCLRKLLVNTNKNRKVICLGDFNATTSAAWHNSSLRENSIVSSLEVNDNGERFHNFFDTCCLSVLNTWFNHKKCRRVTWYSPDGITQKVYDFILVCSWLRQFTKNCRVYRSYDFDSDHRLVITTLNTPRTKTARYRKRKKKKSSKKLDIKMLETISLNQPLRILTPNLQIMN